MRYLGRNGAPTDAALVEIGSLYRVERNEARARWTGPRANWPESHVLTREDLDAGAAQNDRGYSWEPPEFYVHAIASDERSFVFCVEDDFHLVNETYASRRSWEDADRRRAANRAVLGRLELLCSWARFERKKGQKPMPALHIARMALEQCDARERE